MQDTTRNDAEVESVWNLTYANEEKKNEEIETNRQEKIYKQRYVYALIQPCIFSKLDFHIFLIGATNCKSNHFIFQS